MVWAVFALLMLTVLAMLLVPLFRRRDAGTSRGEYDLTVYRDQLAEVDRDLDRGLLTPQEAEAARVEIQRRLLAVTDSSMEASSTGSAGGAGWRTAALLAVILPGVAVPFYLYTGQPGVPGRPFAEGPAPAAPAAAGNMGDVVTRLAERMRNNPGDLQGWLLLARSYMSMERYAAAADAFRRAMEVGGNRADIAADYAEARVIANDTVFSAEIRQLFRGVRRADPWNPKARYYLAIDKAQKGDLMGALQGWVDLVALSPADAPWLAIVRGQMAQAGETLNIDPAAVKPSAAALELAAQRPAISAGTAPQAAPPSPSGPSREQVEAASEMSADERNQMIATMVARLAARLEENPNDLEGWRQLERAYRVLGEPDKAARAAARAAELGTRAQ